MGFLQIGANGVREVEFLTNSPPVRGLRIYYTPLSLADQSSKAERSLRGSLRLRAVALEARDVLTRRHEDTEKEMTSGEAAFRW